MKKEKETIKSNDFTVSLKNGKVIQINGLCSSDRDKFIIVGTKPGESESRTFSFRNTALNFVISDAKGTFKKTHENVIGYEIFLEVNGLNLNGWQLDVPIENPKHFLSEQGDLVQIYGEIIGMSVGAPFPENKNKEESGEKPSPRQEAR